ncbi:hypothetical protein OTK49_02025 [Vibrio coralliirubri]|uniref:hypothetical protein n=1 Tax=Vibrio coralliirubri TaxID=1516159 RepID=UPI00228399F9|nr:hypothetical protein [Vibrio coralliirubri]MCY9861292.1 hypothetical protein [Vibrio coralliirubri]
MPKQTTAQTTISYRHAAGKNGTSKVSLQPAIYEALVERHGDSDAQAREYIKELALQGRKLKVKDLSLYVQSIALISLMPVDIQGKVKLNLSEANRIPLRYKNTVEMKMTKLTTFKVLHDILNVVYSGSSEDIHTKFANEAHKAKKATEAKLGELNAQARKTCDISHQVRERIISNLIASFG